MSWRFRRRIKIAPGVHINISKSGVSTSVGVRGANMTFGKNGTYLNTGIPGTGYYNRQRIGGGNPQSSTHQSVVTSTGNSSSNGNPAPLGCFALLILMVGIFLLYSTLNSSHEKHSLALSYLIIGIGVFVLFLYFLFGNNKKRTNITEIVTKQAESLLALTDEPIKKRIVQNYIDCYKLNALILEEQIIIQELNKKQEKKASEKNGKLIEEHTLKLHQLQSELERFQYNVDKELTENEKLGYAALCEQFENLMKSEEKQYIYIPKDTPEHLIQYLKKIMPLKLEVGSFNYLHSCHDVPIFCLDKEKVYIYPKFVIKAKSELDFTVEDRTDNTFACWKYEQKDAKVNDSKLVRNEYEHQRKDGSPDMRYSYNPLHAIYEYGYVELSLKNEKFHLLFSNLSAAFEFCKTSKISILLPQLEDTTKKAQEKMKFITQDSFDAWRSQAVNLNRFLQNIRKDKQLMSLISERYCLSNMDGTPWKDDLKFTMCACMDAYRCLFALGHNLEQMDDETICYLVFVWMVEKPKGTEITYDKFAYFKENVALNIKEAIGCFLTVENYANLEDGTFHLGRVLEEYDKDLKTQYLNLLFRFAVLLAKIDNVVDENEKQWISGIMKEHPLLVNEEKENVITDTNDEKRDEDDCRKEEQVKPTQKIKETAAKSNLSLDALNNLIGLQTVKEEITKLSSFIKIQKLREGKGLPVAPISYHCVFTGNPGTGKTTVARIIAGIYKDLGILKTGQLIETDRSGLVAEFVGQTAVKTNKIIDKALDGVLFIDEAYSLVSTDSQDFGKEAIATLLKRMEDDRDRLVVILAGYGNEMKQFIDINPGLQSRFNRYIHFSDYDENELFAIFKSNLDRNKMFFTPEAENCVKALLKKKVIEKDKNFGNGRMVRNLFEKTLEMQSLRLVQEVNPTEERLSEIRLEDVDKLQQDVKL